MAQTSSLSSVRPGVGWLVSVGDRLRRLVLRLVEIAIVVGVVLGIWQALVLITGFPAFILPPPLAVLQYLVEEREQILDNSATTIQEVVLGFFMALGFGFPVAVLVSGSRIAEKTVFPLLVIMRTVPTLALAPLFVLVFGFDILPKLLVVFLIAFFPIVVSSAVGLKSVPQEMRSLVRSMGAGQLVSFSKISFPYALPHIFAGIKLGAVLSVSGAIVGEFIGSSSGLGYLIVFSISQQNARMVYAGIMTIVIMGVLMFILVDAIERLAIPWHVSRREKAA